MIMCEIHPLLPLYIATDKLVKVVNNRLHILQVMRRMGECTCNNKIKVKNCGRGKFIVRGVSGRNIIIYARVSITMYTEHFW